MDFTSRLSPSPSRLSYPPAEPCNSSLLLHVSLSRLNAPSCYFLLQFSFSFSFAFSKQYNFLISFQLKSLCLTNHRILSALLCIRMNVLLSGRSELCSESSYHLPISNICCALVCLTDRSQGSWNRSLSGERQTKRHAEGVHLMYSNC